MIAEKILRDPRVLEIARGNLKRWGTLNGASATNSEWARLLEEGNARAIVIALLRVDEEGMRLRSSSPFAGVLDEAERELVYRAARK
jgi:hypothetical protein